MVVDLELVPVEDWQNKTGGKVERGSMERAGIMQGEKMNSAGREQNDFLPVYIHFGALFSVDNQCILIFI